MTTLPSKIRLDTKQIALQRYNLVKEEEMNAMKWIDENGVKYGTGDTYMDTLVKT